MKQIEIRRKWPKLYKHISQRASEFYDKMMETQNDSDIELIMSAFEYDGNVIRLLPALIISQQEADKLIDIVCELVAEFE